MTRSIAAATILAAALAADPHVHAEESRDRASLVSAPAGDRIAHACAQVSAPTSVRAEPAAVGECERASLDAATAAIRTPGTPRIRLLEGCEAAAQLGQACSSNDGLVLAIDY